MAGVGSSSVPPDHSGEEGTSNSSNLGKLDKVKHVLREKLPLLDMRWGKQGRGIQVPSTPLQNLLDPGHSLLATTTSFQTDHSLHRPYLPNLTDLQTNASPQGFDFIFDDSAEMPTTTLEESFVQALIQALYEALPDSLNTPDPASPPTTPSGALLGRHRGSVPVSRHKTVTTHVVAPAEQTPQEPAEKPLPAAEPVARQYVMGVVDEGTLSVTRKSLAELDFDLPAEGSPGYFTGKALLGRGEAAFLRAQSALWAWRTHDQPNLELYTDGPPMPGRNVLIEQKIGPVTLLHGRRVTEQSEGPRHWEFKLGSLSGQVVRSLESFQLEWCENDDVVFKLQSHQQITLASLAVLRPVYSAVRRVVAQGYLRNIRDLSAE